MSNQLPYTHSHNNSKYHKYVFINHTYHQQSSFNATIKTHANMICAYTRHIYACGTKSPQGRTHDATKTSLSTAIINNYITSDTTYDA
jgi:hypothetical protein